MQLVLTHAEMRARDEHRAIADAARDGDATLGVTLMRDHILGAGRALVTFVEAQRNERDTHATGNGA
jgi:DNA-binding GntR family transcriptional regulator